MEKFTFDRGKGVAKIASTFVILLFSVFSSNLVAQCPLGCNNRVQVSLGGDCKAEITPEMILEGEGVGCAYDVTILGPNDVPFPDDTVRIQHIGRTLKVEVSDGTSNKCWGYIHIEDKAPPVWLEPNPDTIRTVCYDNYAFELDYPAAEDNCNNPVDIDLISDEVTDLDCNDPDTLSARRIQIWLATDLYGNESVFYYRVIEYMRIGLDSILFPDNRDDIELPILEACGSWDLNDNDYPDPWVDLDNDGRFDAGESESGIPTTTDGYAIYPNKSYCEINATYSDKVIDICEKSFKVLRNWTILDWCTTEVRDSFQIVKVLDTTDPVATTVPDRFITEYADPYYCGADVRIPAPFNIFDCTTVNYEVSYILADVNTGAPVNGLYIDENVRRVNAMDTGQDGVKWSYYYVIDDLPVGLTWLRYTLTDACGNVTEAFTEILVIDNVPPIPVCDEHTVVTLTATGFAKVFAQTFDDGSHDNCTDVHFDVRRLEDNLSPSTRCSVQNAQFRDYVEFCCADAGMEFMVELRVWDDGNGSGIFGDEIPIYEDTNDDGIFGNTIRGISDKIIGYQKDNYNTCMILTKVQDKIDPIIYCPPDLTVDCETDLWNLDIFGTVQEDKDDVEPIVLSNDVLYKHDGPLVDGYAVDNCEVTVKADSAYFIDNCQVGHIIRTFTATDGGGRSDVCQQRIDVQDIDPFDGNINWPEDIILEGCEDLSTDPEDLAKLDKPGFNYGFPLYEDDFCTQLALTYEDQVFNFVDGVCFKILRKWTIIDWCQYDRSNREYGYWHYTQVIKVNDPDAPVIQVTTNKNYCTYGPNCGGYVEIVNDAVDCTPDEELEWEWEIDIDNDDNDNPEYTGFSNDASGIYPVGTHKITWRVEDMCGNLSSKSYLITIEDCKNPTPYCISEITTVVMPTTGDVEIWAKDFDRGSFDNCPGPLRFSFEEPNPSLFGLGLDSSMVFTCPQDSGMQELNIYVVDRADKWDYCTVTLNIQVNHDCQDDGETGGPVALVTGTIRTPNNDNIDNVDVMLEDMDLNNKLYFQTNNDGTYTFSEMPASKDYKLTADKIDDPLNGVSTLDIVHIQRHILGIKYFDQPYQVIAADINNNNALSAADIIQLRKLILGIYDEFPSNTNWKFVDGEQVYADNSRPWEYQEYIMVENLVNHADNNNFIGVKIGDVNMDADYNARNQSTIVRSNTDAILSVKDVNFSEGEEVYVDFTLDQINEIVGYQMTLEFNDEDLDLIEVYSDVINVTDDNLGLTQPGIITMSWNDVASVALEKDQPLFTLVFRANTNSTISENVDITSNITSAEAYTSGLEVANIELAFTKIATEAAILLQNRPNPFTESTVIGFILPEAAPATLTIYDVTGRVLQQVKGNFPAGKNSVELDGQQLDVDGILYYQLESGQFKSSKKMIKINK